VWIRETSLTALEVENAGRFSPIDKSSLRKRSRL
jgi:hypothetical protein